MPCHECLVPAGQRPAVVGGTGFWRLLRLGLPASHGRNSIRWRQYSGLQPVPAVSEQALIHDTPPTAITSPLGALSFVNWPVIGLSDRAIKPIKANLEAFVLHAV